MPTTISVHGNAIAIPESPGSGDAFNPGNTESVNGLAGTEFTGLRQGPGTTYRGHGGKSVFFHLPMPMPVKLNGLTGFHLSRLDLFFDCDAGASLSAVELFGTNNERLLNQTGLSEVTNFSLMPSPWVRINEGLDVAMLMMFSMSANVTFRGATAFLMP